MGRGLGGRLWNADGVEIFLYMDFLSAHASRKVSRQRKIETEFIVYRPKVLSTRRQGGSKACGDFFFFGFLFGFRMATRNDTSKKCRNLIS